MATNGQHFLDSLSATDAFLKIIADRLAKTFLAIVSPWHLPPTYHLKVSESCKGVLGKYSTYSGQTC